jgi:hypothetical protein
VSKKPTGKAPRNGSLQAGRTHAPAGCLLPPEGKPEAVARRKLRNKGARFQHQFFSLSLQYGHNLKRDDILLPHEGHTDFKLKRQYGQILRAFDISLLHWGHNCISSGSFSIFAFFLIGGATAITIITIPPMTKNIPKSAFKRSVMIEPRDKIINPKERMMSRRSLVSADIFETTNSPSFNLNSHLVSHSLHLA